MKGSPSPVLCVCQVGLVEMSPTEASYRSLLGKLMEHDSDPLVQAYGAIEELLKDVLVYVKVCMLLQTSAFSILICCSL